MGFVWRRERSGRRGKGTERGQEWRFRAARGSRCGLEPAGRPPDRPAASPESQLPGPADRPVASVAETRMSGAGSRHGESP